jgi:hypothetical protein
MRSSFHAVLPETRRRCRLSNTLPCRTDREVLIDRCYSVDSNSERPVSWDDFEWLAKSIEELLIDVSALGCDAVVRSLFRDNCAVRLSHWGMANDFLHHDRLTCLNAFNAISDTEGASKRRRYFRGPLLEDGIARPTTSKASRRFGIDMACEGSRRSNDAVVD